jgi:hypothetical protein
MSSALMDPVECEERRLRNAEGGKAADQSPATTRPANYDRSLRVGPLKITNKYSPTEPEVFRLLPPQRELTAIGKIKSKPTVRCANSGALIFCGGEWNCIVPELSNSESPPAKPGGYPSAIIFMSTALLATAKAVAFRFNQSPSIIEQLDMLV